MKSNCKEVREKIKNHILEDFTVEELKGNINNLKYGKKTTYEACRDFVEGGAFYVYVGDAEKFLNTLNLNNNSNKIFSNDEIWEKYVYLLAREIEKLIK